MMDDYQTRRRVLQTIGVTIGSSAVIGTASAWHPETYEAELTDDAHGLDTGASGHVEFEADSERGEVHYTLCIDRICHPTQAHIHLGGEGEDGPVVVWLYPEDQQEPEPIDGFFQGTLAEGTFTADDLVGPLEGASFEEVVTAMVDEEVYVNVHTEVHPGGEIRGQITPAEKFERPDETEEPDEEEPADGPVSFEVEEVATGLSHPWSIAFLPDDSQMLVTEREGRLNLVNREDGSVEPVDGTPDVYVEGQGGLLDVMLHPDFPDEPWVYLTYAAANDGGQSATHLGRGRLDRDEARLEAFEVLHVAEPFADSDAHYGSRVVFGEDGMLYMSAGDRRFTDFGPDHVAQDTTNELGATLRLEPDGSIPDDNPFVDDEDARDAIFSYGHRNVQGMTVHPETGAIWQSEHGEEDGDEINIIEAGGNHGWPVAHYGCEYGTDDPIGDQPHERDDVVNPIYYWECNSGGFSPSGATFYDGDAFSEWWGNLFVGNLADEYLGRFTVNGTDVEEADPLLSDRGWRIRDVKVAPSTGHLYVAVDDEDAPIVRLVPE